MSHQVCSCCGWSKVTTYQGLRTHQGKMGCTPKGVSIPQSQQFSSSFLPRLFEPTTTIQGLRFHQGTMGCTSNGIRIPENSSSDTSLQVCHCGWSKVTTYQGLRTHQGMMGCTQKGIRIPESELFTAGSVLPQPTFTQPIIKQQEPVTDIITASTESDSSADTSLQICHCGWSQVTTYQGLRTHQGMKGCTQKGIRIPESEQFTAGSFLSQLTITGPAIKQQEPVTDIVTASTELDSSADTSLQICHCGWSQVTTYQGLRTHQGMKGCTQKGIRIPESEQFTAGSFLSQLTITGPAIKQQEPVTDIVTASTELDSSSDTSLQVCHCGWSQVTTYQGLRTHQGMKGCTQKGIRIPKSEQFTAGSFLSQLTITGQAIKREEPVTDIVAASPGSGSSSDTSADDSSDDEHKSTRMDDQKRNQFNWTSPQVKQPAFMASTPGLPPAAWDGTQRVANRAFFQTPQSSQQTSTSSDKVRRVLDFSAGAQQVQVSPNDSATAAKDPNDKDLEAEKVTRDIKKAEIQQLIHSREQKVNEVKTSLKGCQVSIDAEWLQINSVFSLVVELVEEARQEALQPLEERSRRLKSEAQDLIQDLDQEIQQLRKTMEDLEQNPELQIPLNQWEASVDTTLSFTSLRAITSAMMEGIQQEVEKLSSVELKRIPTFTVDVKLDPGTAHQSLVLSEDRKEVRDGGKPKTAPDSPQRFDTYGSILAVNSLTCGRSYWEVGVANKSGWDLGVARGDANRKGELSLSPDAGYWAIVHYEGNKYAALTASRVSLSLTSKPKIVGVFVDYEEGIVSFYDAQAHVHIHTFARCSFGGAILPYFSPHLRGNGRNADALVIGSGK